MKSFNFLLFLSFLLAPTITLSAPYQNFIGLDASMVTVENSIGETLDPENFRLRLGTALSPLMTLKAI